jgi:murein DD-endopeptidase MepM/ murein hydrolase activator NlpD
MRAALSRIGVVTALAALALLTVGAGIASAQTGGATPPGSTTPPPTTPTTTAGYTHVFPIPPSINHSYGDGFGTKRGKRKHQGVDVFARCSSMLIAVSNGKIVRTGFQKAAGHYLILRHKPLREDYVYMHLAYPAPVAKGTNVTAGQFIGAVGQTGNAHGCHLHFEIWRGKWYRGGRAVNPLSALEYWDSYS